MVDSRTPKYIVLAATLGVAAAIIVLSISISQYRWLESAAKHNELLQTSFEQKSKAEIEKLGNHVYSEFGASDPAVMIDALNNALASSHSINGLRFKAEGLDAILVGDFPAGDPGNQTTWLESDLLVSYTILDFFLEEFFRSKPDRWRPRLESTDRAVGISPEPSR